VRVVPQVSVGRGDPVLLVSVPCFATAGEAVLVDLGSLDCAPLRFRGLAAPAGAAPAAAVGGAMEDS